VFALIEEQSGAHGREKMARLLSVSRSGYYRYRNKKPSQHDRENEVYRDRIGQLFKLSRETYGSDRMQRELAKEGICLGKRRIIRLMKDADLIPKKRRFFKKTTVVDPRHPVAEGLKQMTGVICFGTYLKPLSREKFWWC